MEGRKKTYNNSKKWGYCTAYGPVSWFEFESR